MKEERKKINNSREPHLPWAWIPRHAQGGGPTWLHNFKFSNFWDPIFLCFQNSKFSSYMKDLKCKFEEEFNIESGSKEVWNKSNLWRLSPSWKGESRDKEKRESKQQCMHVQHGPHLSLGSPTMKPPISLQNLNFLESYLFGIWRIFIGAPSLKDCTDMVSSFF